MKSVGLISLGCAKNRVDAERILGSFAAVGYQVVQDPAQAEVVVVNTCGFIREAVEESIEEILDAARLKKEGSCRVLVVAGCLPQRYRELAQELPEVDFFFTPGELENIPAAIAGEPPADSAVRTPRVLTQMPHSTYLKIADGCSNRCSYCTIPLIRGPFRSVPADELVAEARQLVARGAVELNLVAQDVTGYGRDGDEAAALDSLLGRLEAIDGLHWIRLLYAYPRPLPPGVAARLAGAGKVVPYLDVPIQHAHPRILAAMHRRVSADAAEGMLLGLQDRYPDLVLRTTAIVGFPGETDAEFQALVDLVQRVRFHHLGAFAYSPEEGTAAEELPGRVPGKVVRERLDHLMEVQAEISYLRNQAFVGRELEVLVDGLDEEGNVVGRTYGQAPEVDGHTLLDNCPEAVGVGAFLRCRVREAWEYDLLAEVLQT
ncbi:MAG TPA: 30S ribosomal protein S12 methylthiotransferase RimO [Deferrisomatales bacterium]|nr:30S ribosomal protein S12 methylthiotransferase RimO [Deferrisomatales bacterium]